MVLYRELYEIPTSIHPYARYDALPGDLEKLNLEATKAWYKQHFTPRNAVLVVTGDVDPDAIQKSITQAFKDWKGERPTPVSFSEPMPDADHTLFVVDRPGSGQSQVYVGLLGPERQSEDWPALAATNQILGGGVSGRLFLDVREKRSLAYSTGSSLEEPAHARVPIVLSAGTQTPKTALAVQALLENLEKIGKSAPSEAEVEIASRYLSDSFLFRMETAGAIAELTTKLAVLDLPDDYYDEYRRAVRKLDPVRVGKIAERYFQKKGAVIVVAGDASKVSKPLTHFGKVTVIDPEQGFSPGQQLPHDPGQKIQ
jgi:predicted Zn-dependent peptidase